MNETYELVNQDDYWKGKKNKSPEVEDVEEIILGKTKHAHKQWKER